MRAIPVKKLVNLAMGLKEAAGEDDYDLELAGTYGVDKDGNLVASLSAAAPIASGLVEAGAGVNVGRTISVDAAGHYRFRCWRKSEG